MATYWVRATNGSDAADGLTFATARQTISSIVTKMVADVAAKGSICNIVNEATYAWPTSEVNITTGLGTSFSDFGYLFRGVSDSSATPAFATVAASGGDATRRWIQINSGGGYIIVRNLIFDATDKTADASVYTVCRYNSSGGPVWFDGCALLAAGTGVSHSGTRQLLALNASAPDGTRIYDCYFQNIRSAVHSITGATLSASHIGNLFIFDVAGTSVTLLSRTLAAGTGDTFDWTYNTMYWNLGANGLSSPIVYSVAGTNAGPVNVNSNLMFVDTTLTGVELLDDTAGGSVPWSGTIDNNVLIGGTNVAIGDLTAGWYIGTFDTGGDPKPSDQVAFGQAEATIFNAPASTYAWDPLGNGATITILKDLRPRLYLTAGLGSTVPGALPAASTDYGIDLATDNTAPEVDTAFTITVTASNTGTAATGITMTALVPAGLTLTTATPSAGSYVAGTGLWTIGSLASGGSATLTLAVTVDADQGGNTIIMTATTTSGDPANDPNSANNSDTLSLPIPIDADTDPIETVYLDVAPIFAPVLLAEINAVMRTKRNRVTQHDQRKDYERRTWRESTSRRITVAPSTTVSIISAIERIDFFVMEATGDLEVSASNSATDVYFPAASRVTLLAGDFTTLKLRNPSATTAVDALLVVID